MGHTRHGVVVAAIGTAFTSLLAQVPFTVDTGFQAGVVWDAYNVASVSNVLVQPDGRLLIAGTTGWPGAQSSFNTWRLMPDGTRDQGFVIGTGEFRIFPCNDSTYFGRRGISEQGLRRHRASTGEWETSFQFADHDHPDAYEMDYMDAFLPMPDGRVLISGRYELSDTVNGQVGVRNLVWLDAEGHLDTSRPAPLAPRALFLDHLPDGRVIVGGYAGTYEGHAVGPVYIIHADGRLDTTFHTTHINGSLMGVHARPDGRIIGMGMFVHFNSLISLDTSYVIQWMPDGSRDPGFNDLLRMAKAGSFPYVLDIEPLADGTHLISGTFDRIEGQARGGIARISDTGQLLDPLPGTGARPMEGNCSVRMARAADGGIYLHGVFSSYDDGSGSVSGACLARLHVPSIITGIHVPHPRAILSVHPMPAQGPFTITLVGDEDVVAFELCDGMGRLERAWSPATARGPWTCDPQGLPCGTHLLTARSANGARITQRMIIIP